MSLMDPKLRVYNQEIFNYLNSLTIKFSPFSNFYNRFYKNVLNIDVNDPSTQPYYIMLQGEYHKFIPIVYLSSETFSEDTILNKTNLDTKPQIREYFQVHPNKIYDLYGQYPASTEVIKCSIFPLEMTIDEIVQTPDFQILNDYPNYLNKREQDIIPIYIQHFLDYINYRWYINTFESEDLYPGIFWSLLWGLLFLYIQVVRILNIRTKHVHDYHITEYLLSNGFKECKLYINNSVREFLYKNHEFLKKHRGKHILLEIIDEFILNPTGFYLASYSLHKHTANCETEGIWKPEFIARDLSGSYDENDIVNKENFQYYLYTKGLISNYDYHSNLREFNKITFNKYNSLLTKFLLLKQSTSSTLFDKFLYALSFDLLVWNYSQGKLDITYDLTKDILISVSSIQLEMSNVYDLIVLLHYALNKCINTDVNLLPTTYECFTIRNSDEIIDNLDDRFYMGLNKDTYIKYFYHLEEALINYTHAETRLPISNQDEYYWYLHDIFTQLVNDVWSMRQNGNFLHNRATIKFLNQVFERKVIDIPIPDEYEGFTTYDTYFNYRQDLRDTLDLFSTTEEYLLLVKSIFFHIFNIDDSFSRFTSNERELFNIECLYDILKKYNSYNVNYIVSYSEGKIIVPTELIQVGILNHEDYLGTKNIIEYNGPNIQVEEYTISETKIEMDIVSNVTLNPDDGSIIIKDEDNGNILKEEENLIDDRIIYTPSGNLLTVDLI